MLKCPYPVDRDTGLSAEHLYKYEWSEHFLGSHREAVTMLEGAPRYVPPPCLAD